MNKHSQHFFEGYAGDHATLTLYTRGSTIFRDFGWKVVRSKLLGYLSLRACHAPTEGCIVSYISVPEENTIECLSFVTQTHLISLAEVKQLEQKRRKTRSYTIQKTSFDLLFGKIGRLLKLRTMQLVHHT